MHETEKQEVEKGAEKTMSKTMYEIEGYLFEVIGWEGYNGKPIPIIDNCSIGKIKELPEAATSLGSKANKSLT